MLKLTYKTKNPWFYFFIFFNGILINELYPTFFEMCNKDEALY